MSYKIPQDIEKLLQKVLKITGNNTTRLMYAVTTVLGNLGPEDAARKHYLKNELLRLARGHFKKIHAKTRTKSIRIPKGAYTNATRYNKMIPDSDK